MKLIFRIIIFSILLMPSTVQGQEWKITDAQREFMIKLMKAEENTPDLMTLLPYDFSTEQTNLVADHLQKKQYREALNEVLDHFNNSTNRLIPNNLNMFKNWHTQYYGQLFRATPSLNDVDIARINFKLITSVYMPPQIIKDSMAWYPDILNNLDSIPANSLFPDSFGLRQAFFQLGAYDKVTTLLEKETEDVQNFPINKKYKIYILIKSGKFSEADQLIKNYMESAIAYGKIEDIIFNASALFKQAGLSDKAASLCQIHLTKYMAHHSIKNTEIDKMGWYDLFPLYRYTRCAKGVAHTQTQKYWQKLNEPDIRKLDFFMTTRLIDSKKEIQPLEKLATIDGPNPALLRAFYLIYLSFALNHQDLYYEELQIARKALAKLGPDKYFGNFKDLD